MNPRYLLYLTVEGVVVPPTVSTGQLSGADSFRWREKKHLAELADIVGPMEWLGIVLHSDRLLEWGIRPVMGILPQTVRGRIVGGTIHGNRLIHRGKLPATPGRRARLDADVRRRQPDGLTVLECDARYVPVPLRDDAVIVSMGLWNASSEDWRRLRESLDRYRKQ